MKKAVVLVSGGMDSAVVLAIAREQGFAVHALSVRYGQRHTSELDAAARVASSLRELDLFLSELLASGIPVDYVPGWHDPTNASWPQSRPGTGFSTVNSGKPAVTKPMIVGPMFSTTSQS